ncbi:hypothetical protein PR048_017088 [Dryococelus australis]|uniref:Uncharacterized protein n=1 Tax=Dryococelus australis TaxID=614101 RepID=A0ABQ9H8J7_9NEOP|nr:hypothetical protein PR048_017088 [Dryococelus australis]
MSLNHFWIKALYSELLLHHSPNDLKLAYHGTQTHLDVTKLRCQKMKTAMQLFSRSVSKAPIFL